jgi:3-hydroxyacyl-CoA dehydrogenase
MSYRIRKAAVLGAGTMGAAIAAHFANVGIPSLLLDIVPGELTADEARRGLTLDDRAVRNRIAREGLERCLKARPANLYHADLASLIRIGNFDDDFEQLAEADWIVEAVVERLDIKQALMARVDAVRRPAAIVSTNTSGIPVHQIADGRSVGFRAHFLGTHFFNPPRYLHLLELIPTAETEPGVADFLQAFCEDRLGKGVVRCKDTPNFIANRILSIAGSIGVNYAFANGYTVEEVDALTGPAIGRPKTATFRLNDLVGIDVLAHVSRNLYQAIPDDPYREVLVDPRASEAITRMIEKGWLGNKTDVGFYKKVVVDGKREFWPLDLERLEHRAPIEPDLPSVAAARGEDGLPARLRALAAADDRGGAYVWHVLSRLLAYAAACIPGISDDLLSIDRACRWGFQWELGPFETWDALGLRASVDRMRAEGVEIPSWIDVMLSKGNETFYKRRAGEPAEYYDPASGTYRPIRIDPRQISVDALRSQGRELQRNDGASLLDMGDGVLLLEFHSKANALDDDIFDMAAAMLDRLEEDEWAGAVIGNQGKHFSVGANIFTIAVAAQQGEYDLIDAAIRKMQTLLQRIRYSPKPIVAAPFGMTLGGGCEIIMACSRVVASAESYIGLVEVGVGLIPAGTGSTEVVRRIISRPMSTPHAQPISFLQQAFEQIGLGKVATSAVEARAMHYLTENDRMVVHPDHLLAEAKQEVLAMVQGGFVPAFSPKLYAAGRDAFAALRVAVDQLREGGYASEHDARVGERLGHVLCGGELSAAQWVPEGYFLDLERQAFLDLCKEPKTIERIWYMLQHNKPLRN